MARSRIKGIGNFRRLLRRLEPSARDQLGDLLEQAGPVLADRMRSRVPVLASPRQGRVAGALKAGISSRVLRKALNLKVGLLTKGGRTDLFYGHILDVGNKAKTVVIGRGKRKGESLAIPARTPLRLEAQGVRDFRQQFLPDYRSLTQRILADASQGGDDD